MSAEQPPLPFEPALQLVSRPTDAEPEREVSLDRFMTLVFEEVARRAAALPERGSSAAP